MDKIILKDNDLTKNTPMGGNIDVDRYKFCIIDAQQSALEEILGSELKEKMVTDFPNFSGEYELLYPYVRLFLIHQSTAEYLLVGAYQISNAGIYKATPVNGNPNDKTENDLLLKNQQYKAQMYRIRLEKYLCKNGSKMPEYKCSTENSVNPIRDFGESYDFV